jgi:hypothetical protein
MESKLPTTSWELSPNFISLPTSSGLVVGTFDIPGVPLVDSSSGQYLLESIPLKQRKEYGCPASR